MPTKLDSSNLDFLRSNAVLAVLCFHLMVFFGKTQWGPVSVGPLGLFGVLLFFVHTSLVLMFSLERQEPMFKKGSLFLVFMLRRTFRIYPLSVLVVATIAAFGLPLAQLHPGHFLPGHLGWSGVVSNLLLIQNITDVPSILGPLWSLPYEIQMYVFLPAMFLVARRVRSLWPLLGLWALFVGVAAIHARFGHMPDLVRFIPCFLPGVIAYKALLLRQASPQPRSQWSFWGWPVFLLAICGGFVLGHGKENGWAACLLTGLAIPQFAEMRSLWLRRTSQLIAKYSYGIYLMHYFCMWLAFVVCSRFPAALQWGVFIIVLPASCMALYHGLEAPMILLGNYFAKTLFGMSARQALQEPMPSLAATEETAPTV